MTTGIIYMCFYVRAQGVDERIGLSSYEPHCTQVSQKSPSAQPGNLMFIHSET